MSAGLSSNVETVERLRERIRQLQAQPRPSLSVLPTGIAAFDELCGGGLPLGAVVELRGEPASGKTSLALRALAQVSSDRRLGAYVDCPQQLYAPLARSLGVDLDSTLVVRPGAPKQGTWAALQLARSGVFACTVLDLTQTAYRFSPAEGKQLMGSAARSGSTVILLTTQREQVEAGVRLSLTVLGLEGFEVAVLRSRRGGHPRARIAWQSLYPSSPTWRHRPPSEVRIQLLREPTRLPGFSRENPSLLRNGMEGVRGQRPGRDLTLPLLTSPALGG